MIVCVATKSIISYPAPPSTFFRCVGDFWDASGCALSQQMFVFGPPQSFKQRFDWFGIDEPHQQN